jgi:hypothetical protein
MITKQRQSVFFALILWGALLLSACSGATTPTTTRPAQPSPSPAPSGGSLVLFDGKSLVGWRHSDGRPAEWVLLKDGMVACCGDILSDEAFQDFKLHLEFWLPRAPDDVTNQLRSNSGVYLQGRYEIQVLDSFGVEPPSAEDAGAIYGQTPPRQNAALPPETWQTYEITFRAARFDSGGQKVEDARVSLLWNGVLVLDHVALPGPTAGGDPEGPAPGQLRLQDHGDPVRYRNIWIEPLGEKR